MKDNNNIVIWKEYAKNYDLIERNGEREKINGVVFWDNFDNLSIHNGCVSINKHEEDVQG